MVTETVENEKPKEKMLFSISEILPHLYLSGYGCITEGKMKEFGITHAVDATNLKTVKLKNMSLDVLNVDVDDNEIARISPHFQPVADFVDAAKAKGGKTIIFCAAGVSRSATLAIMYLVFNEKMSLRDAYYKVNAARPIVSPNIGFWRQMIDAEKQTNGNNTVELIRGRTARPLPDVYLHRSLTNYAR